MKILVLGNLRNDPELEFLSKLLPSIATTYGVDVTVAIDDGSFAIRHGGDGGDFQADDGHARLLRRLGIDLLVCSRPRPCEAENRKDELLAAPSDELPQILIPGHQAPSMILGGDGRPVLAVLALSPARHGYDPETAAQASGSDGDGGTDDLFEALRSSLSRLPDLVSRMVPDRGGSVPDGNDSAHAPPLTSVVCPGSTSAASTPASGSLERGDRRRVPGCDHEEGHRTCPGDDRRRPVPVLLFLRHRSELFRLAVLENFSARLSAVIGLGSGLASTGMASTGDGCGFLSDFGLSTDRPGFLAREEDDWSGDEPSIDGIVLETDDCGHGFSGAFRCRWDSSDIPSDESSGSFSHEVFYNALKKATAASSGESLFDEILGLSRLVLGHERVAVAYRLNPRQGSRFHFSGQLFPDDRPAFERYADRLLEKNELILVPDSPATVGDASYLVAADWTDDEPAGPRCILGVLWSGGENVPTDTGEVVGEIYRVLVTSLQRLRFTESLREQVDRTTMLLELSNALSTTIDLYDLLRRVVVLATRNIGAEHCSVLLYDSDDDHLVTSVSTADVDERIPSGQGIAGWVFSHGQSQVVNDPSSDPRPDPLLEQRRGFTTRNLVCVPLKVKDRIIGVMELRNKIGGEFDDGDLELLEAVAAQSANPIENARLHENVRAMYRSTVEALASAIDAKDPYTHGHSRRVTMYAQAMAEALGWSEEEMEEILYVGLLHDIGKIGVDDAILGKKGPLTDEERAHINLHPARGAEMLEHVSFLVGKIPGVRHHHERYDGKGYPDGLAGDEIPVHAQIICIVDAFDAMTSDRPYRSGMAPETALERILQCKGTQFAPRYVEVFERIFQDKIIPLYRRSKEEPEGSGD